MPVPVTTTATLDDAATARILQGIEIPPQPQVLRVVMAEQQKEYPDLRKIAAAVAKDVGLSAAMLRAANSPAFALRQRVSSIQQAVMLLGLGNAISLITGLSMRMVLSGKGKLRFDQFWEYAADTAIICSVLAKRFSVMAPDQAYVLGLFHDCGIPLLMQRFDNYATILKQCNAGTEEHTIIEDQALKTNHAVIGYYIARSWCLSEEVREVILSHHDEKLITGHEQRALANQVRMLALAHYLCRACRGERENPTWGRIAGAVMETFSLTDISLKDLSEDMQDILSEHN